MPRRTIILETYSSWVPIRLAVPLELSVRLIAYHGLFILASGIHYPQILDTGLTTSI
jgi:hypothetical protein